MASAPDASRPSDPSAPVQDTTHPVRTPRPTRSHRDHFHTLRVRLAAHAPLVVLLVLATGVRVVATLGYRGALWFSDSFDYVDVARRIYPHTIRPDGYAFWLAALRPAHSFTVVTATQHLMGLAVGVLIYALARRYGVRRWIATAATVPVLLGAYQIQLEHIVLSDTLFALLTVLAVLLAVWPTRDGRAPGTPSRAIALGLVLAASVLTRTVGLPLMVCVVGYLLVRGRLPGTRRGVLRPLLALLAACAVPVAGYALWFHAWHGSYALTSANGVFLYGRATTFVDCAQISPELRRLCPDEPVDERPAPQHYIWAPDAPLNHAYSDKFSAAADRAELEFARQAILAQPGDYLRTVADDVARTFRADRPVYPDRQTYDLYEFPSGRLPDWAAERGAAAESAAHYGGGITTHIVEPYAGFIRAYQDYARLPGAALGVLLLFGAVLMVTRRRAAGVAVLPWGLAVLLLVIPPATAQFDYRYVLPAVPLACLAVVLAVRPVPRGPSGHDTPRR